MLSSLGFGLAGLFAETMPALEENSREKSGGIASMTLWKSSNRNRESGN
jgi:hypothetical protein